MRVQRDKKQAEASFLKKTADEEDEDDDEDDDDNDLSSKNPLSGDGRRPPPLAGGLGKGGESLGKDTHCSAPCAALAFCLPNDHDVIMM